ncbi:MAG: hypothetical protein GW748_06505 [Alphaproteobacteria bacterium]|nr:hypothetical protein [Alphaproteobacteria bacterium]NCQ67377.1 hypothetical protein [Alphaproteobacteria bacterium]NCT06657.1 hypothetical protein [Alphaproteobacteria bacterium]
MNRVDIRVEPYLPSVAHTVVPYVFLILFAIGVIFSYWPGFLSPDSTTQLSQAISGSYSDHHPPMMALYWKLWLWWKIGPEPIFLTYQFLLFGSAFLLLNVLKGKNIRWIVPFIPLFPHILLYSGAIWKDVGFAYTFLFSAMLLFSANFHNRKLSFLKSIIIWLLLFYGTGVKYQALFVLPVMTLWFALTIFNDRSLIKKIGLWLVLWMSILFSCQVLQKTVVSSIGENHSWQNVKLFDLAGMSVRLDKDLFPEFVRQAPEYTFEKMNNTYSPYRVDELIVGWAPGASLRPGETKEQRDILWATWFQALKDHPMAYLSHRLAVWRMMVKRSPMKSLDDLTNVEALPSKIKYVLDVVGLQTLQVIKKLTYFIYYVPFLLFYFFLGLWNWRRKRIYALPLTMMTGSAIALMAALFVFSMASDLRYIYLTMTFFHFSHPLAWLILFGDKKG